MKQYKIVYADEEEKIFSTLLGLYSFTYRTLEAAIKNLSHQLTPIGIIEIEYNMDKVTKCTIIPVKD